MKVSKYHKRVVDQLVTIYPQEEANALMRWIWEDLIQMDRGNRDRNLTPYEVGELEKCLDRLLSGEPIQHILGYGYFYGRKFKVSPEVLIPRQETEELMVWIRDSHFLRNSKQNVTKILDIGTGSGCIPISLGIEWEAKHFEKQLMGLDVSAQALELAKENASKWDQNIQWILKDIFQCEKSDFRDLDILISNPPYIPQQEKEELLFNVKDRDPDQALFVPNEDPLVFYRQIGNLGQCWLKPGGSLYFEVHMDYGREVVDMLKSLGYVDVQLRQDLNKRDRMVRGRRKS